MVRLSILLPTYNGASYLAAQLESIFGQTDADFELLAIDDGSTDATMDILSAWARRDRRLKVFPSSGNHGQESRLLELFGLSTGRYVSIADQDDVWAVDRNQILFGAMDGVDVVFGRSELIDRDGASLGKSLLEAFKVENSSDAKLRSLLYPMFSAHAMIVGRERIHAGLFDRIVPFDWAMALEAVFSGGIRYAPDAVVRHRMHGGNQVNNVDLGSGSRRISLGDLRYSFLFRRPDRLRLWANLDFLRRSRLLPPDVRKSFAQASRIVYNEWFTEWRSLNPFKSSKVVKELGFLRDLAGSRQDESIFFSRLLALSAPAVSLPGLKEGTRRLSMLRS